MNKKKTTVKGFTLIELIIVIAIFSVIMTLVMSFIDPVSKVMTKTSVRERTSAYVDNISEYVSKSIRHAQNIVVYENGLTGNEQDLVTDFVDTYYNGAIDCSGAIDGSGNIDWTMVTPLKGKVHVLKLINETDGGLTAGRIYESVYSFDAGNGRPTTVYFDKNTMSYVDQGTKTDAEMRADGYMPQTKTIFEGENKHAEVNLLSENVSVINDEHFKDYSYYYQLGLCSFDPIPSSADDKYFYSYLKTMTDTTGTAIGDSINEYQFVMNIVSYSNEAAMVDYAYTDDAGNDVTSPSFRSPAAMNSVGMTLKNVQMQRESNSIKYYRRKLVLGKNADGSIKKDLSGYDLYETEKDDKGNDVIEAVTNNLGATPFRRITDGTSKNIYMIFTVPTEIKDSEWVESATPVVPSDGKLVG